MTQAHLTGCGILRESHNMSNLQLSHTEPSTESAQQHTAPLEVIFHPPCAVSNALLLKINRQLSLLALLGSLNVHDRDSTETALFSPNSTSKTKQTGKQTGKRHWVDRHTGGPF